MASRYLIIVQQEVSGKYKLNFHVKSPHICVNGCLPIHRRYVLAKMWRNPRVLWVEMKLHTAIVEK